MHSRNVVTIDNSMHNYMLTIAKHQVKDYVDKSDILEVLHLLKLRLPYLETTDVYSYEISPKYRQLHYHGVVRSPRRIHYKENNTLNGYRLQWSPIYNMESTMAYIYKDAINRFRQEQILDDNYYSHNYGFL